MKIESIKLHNWRNISACNLDISSKVVVLYGENGAGKTNLLESIYVLSSLRSFRDHAKNNLIKKGEDRALIEAKVKSSMGTRNMLWSYSSRARHLSIDNVPQKKISVWFSLIRSILFAPEHINIVRGGPEYRRNFIDRARFIANPSYLSVIQKYLFYIDQKKALLRSKNIDKVVLEILNQNIVEYGIKVILQRKAMLESLQEPFQTMHKNMTEGKEITTLRFKGLGEVDNEKLRNHFEEKLKKMQDEEIRQMKLLVGPHRDDIEILINGFPSKKFASQGQARTIVLALKLAELQAATQRNEYPLFLLDDLSSELDRIRTNRLMSILSDFNNQIWLTTTDPNHLGPVPKNTLQKIRISEGLCYPS